MGHSCILKERSVVLTGSGLLLGKALNLCNKLNQHFVIVVLGKNIIDTWWQAAFREQEDLSKKLQLH